MDQTDKLILQVQGQEQVKELKKELDLWDSALRQLNEQLKLGAISQQQFDAQARLLAGDIVRLEGEIRKLEKSSGTLRSQGLLQLQYVLDDLVNTTGGWERKLSAISNNIPGLAMSLGGKGSMAIAGAIGIVGTALIALTPLAVAAWQALAGGEQGPEPVVKALDAAEEKLRRIRAELGKILESASPEEAKTRRAVEEALAGQGGKVLGGLAGAIATSPQGERMNEAELAAISDEQVERAVAVEAMNASRSGVVFTDAMRHAARGRALAAQQRAKDAAQERINRANLERAGKVLGEAPTSRAARDQLRAMVRRNPGAFPAPADLLAGLDEAEPEARAAWAEVEAQNDENERRLAEKKRRKADLDRRRARAAAALERRTNEDIRAEEEGERLEEQEKRDLGRRTRRAAAKDAARTKADIEVLDAKPHEEAEGRVRAAAAARGFVGPAAPTVEETDQMADEALRLQQQGFNAQAAAMMAVHHKVMQLQRAQAAMNAAFAQQMQMFGGGPDFGGFSMLPPIWP